MENLSKINTNQINIFIATRNRPDDLKRLLESLQKQTNKDFAVTIIDSSDDAAQGIQHIVHNMSGIDIHLRHTSNYGSCTQRNIGLSIIKNDLILISDDDCVFENDAIEHVYNFIQTHPNTSAFNLNIIEKQYRLYRVVTFIKHAFGISNKGKHYIVRRNGINVFGDKDRLDLRIEWLQSCALVLVKKNITENLLKFNSHLEELSGYGAFDDAYLTYNLYLHGHIFGIAKKARVHHSETKNARDNEYLIYKVRTYNRFIFWRDLIYTRNKCSILHFIFTNLLFFFQYMLPLLKFNPNPLLGHLSALFLILRKIRIKQSY